MIGHDRRVIVATMNLGAENATDKGKAYTRTDRPLWVVGGTDNDFYWFRSDNAHGLTTTETTNPNYYVRLVSFVPYWEPDPDPE